MSLTHSVLISTAIPHCCRSEIAWTVSYRALFPRNGVLTNFDSRAVRQSELSAKTGGRCKCRPDGKRGKHEAVSLSSRSPWKSPKNGDYHIRTALRLLLNLDNSTL